MGEEAFEVSCPRGWQCLIAGVMHLRDVMALQSLNYYLFVAVYQEDTGLLLGAYLNKELYVMLGYFS